MISAEAPVLFAKAAEIFITEISLRAWIHTEDNKRRTLQRNDIAMAITKYDQFDFLIDIVPRDELKPTKRHENEGMRNSVTTTALHHDSVQYYLQTLQAQQSSTAAQPIQILQTNANAGGGQFAISPQLLQVQVPSTANASDSQNVTSQPQVLQIAAPTAASNAPKAGQIQILQNVVTSNGEVIQQQIPLHLTPQQLQQLLQQSQTPAQTATNQPIILTSPIQQTALSVPHYQLSGGTQFLQTVVSGAPTNVSAVTQHQSDINSSPQLDDDANET